MNDGVTRRSLLTGGAALTTATALPVVPASAANGQIVVANWGGDWADRTARFFEKPIIEKAGYTVVTDLGELESRRTKILATRRLPVGTLDVAHFDDVEAALLNAQGVLNTVDEKSVPRLADVLQELRKPFFVPWQFSPWVIGYNPDKVKDPPKSFAELWDPKYAGMIGLTDAHWYHDLEMGALGVGGTISDIDKMKSGLASFKRAVRPRIYPQHLQQAQALKNGEISIFTNYKARVLQFKSDGINVDFVYPAEGGIATTYGLVLPKKAPDPEGALFYANSLLDPVGMTNLVERSFYSPANTKATLPPADAAKIDLTADERKHLILRDPETWLHNRAALLEWYGKEFKS